MGTEQELREQVRKLADWVDILAYALRKARGDQGDVIASVDGPAAARAAERAAGLPVGNYAEPTPPSSTEGVGDA